MRSATLAGPGFLGSLLVLSLTIVSVGLHPAALGGRLFILDTSLLLGYCLFFTWGWRQTSSRVKDALAAGARAGVLLGAVLVASHLVEWFGLDQTGTIQWVRGAASTLLMLGVLGAAGSAAWERTRSIGLGVVAGLWSASLGMVILLGFAFTLNLAFEAHAARWLHEAFVASGMIDSGAFVAINALQSASEILTRLPIAALVLSLIGAILNAWITPRSRGLSLLAAWLTPPVIAAGVICLWYANSLERVARPPFILAGLCGAGLGLCALHPAWSPFRRSHIEGRGEN